jgi:hypothetical protein
MTFHGRFKATWNYRVFRLFATLLAMGSAVPSMRSRRCLILAHLILE